ncbi:MAG: hypothetical protein Q7S37_05310 [bacterium]|nr:hypothetical protein [bacterium]
MNYIGTIIKESLQNTDVLNHIQILSTKVEPVTEKHKTPWLKKWTLHKIEIQEKDAETIAQELSKTLEKNYWYADYKNKELHYIIFSNKIFKINRSSSEQYLEAKNYGLSLGIPEYQVDFSPGIK